MKSYWWLLLGLGVYWLMKQQSMPATGQAPLVDPQGNVIPRPTFYPNPAVPGTVIDATTGLVVYAQ